MSIASIAHLQCSVGLRICTASENVQTLLKRGVWTRTHSQWSRRGREGGGRGRQEREKSEGQGKIKGSRPYKELLTLLNLYDTQTKQTNLDQPTTTGWIS